MMVSGVFQMKLWKFLKIHPPFLIIPVWDLVFNKCLISVISSTGLFISIILRFWDKNAPQLVTGTQDSDIGPVGTQTFHTIIRETCLDIESFLIRENITATKAFNLLFKLTLYQTYQRKNCFKLWFSDWVTYFHDRDDMME